MKTRVAIPIAKGKPFPHFGRAPAFRVFDVEDGNILGYQDVDNPTFEWHVGEPHHEHGHDHGHEHQGEDERQHRHVHATLGSLLISRGVSTVVVLHIGAPARERLEADGIRVIMLDLDEGQAIRMDPGDVVKMALNQ